MPQFCILFYANYTILATQKQWRIQKILVGGGIWSQNLKNSDVFTKIKTDFSAKIGNSNVFFAQHQVISNKKKKKKVFTKIETDFSAEFGNSNVFFAQNQVVSKKKKKGLHQNWDWFFGRNRKFKRSSSPKIVKNKKKKVFTKIETDFSAEIRYSNVFFAQNQVVSKKKKQVFTKIETDFSAGFVTFRSMGGMHPEMEPNYSK